MELTIDLLFVLALLGAAVVTRRLRPASRVWSVAAGLAVALGIWGALSLPGLRPSLTALVGSAAIVLVWALKRDRGSDALRLRCAACGNYYPSRDHFASAQICKRCAESGV